MKVYVHAPIIPIEDGTQLYEVLKQKMDEFVTKVKYQVMWALRSIEDEINQETGQVHILPDGYCDPREFSDSLKFKILDLIDAAKYIGGIY